MVINEDNDTVIYTAHRVKGSTYMKHIKMKIAKLQEQVQRKIIEFNRVDSCDQEADGLTKVTVKHIFLKFRSSILRHATLGSHVKKGS